MNPIELLKPDGTKSNVWLCGVCRCCRITETCAERCCKCFICGEKAVWKEDKVYGGPGETYHVGCSKKRQLELYKASLDKAEKVASWDGPVYCEDFQGGNDGYFQSIDELVEEMSDAVEEGDYEIEKWPKWVNTCEIEPLQQLSARDLVYQAAYDSHEEAEERITGIKELQKACDEFNEKNKHIHSYSINSKKATCVPPPDKELLDLIAKRISEEAKA